MQILVASDGSECGSWAVEWVGQLPLKTPKQVEAIHVIDVEPQESLPPAEPVPVWQESLIQKEVDRRIEDGKRVVAETKSLFSAMGIQANVITERGSVASALLRHVKGKGNLLIVGSRGRDAVDRFMLGSVSTKVTHHSNSSVLVVKQKPRPITTILLAIDGSKASAKALDFVINKMMPVKLQSKEPAKVLKVVVIHVLPFLQYPDLKKTGSAIAQRAVDRLAKAGYLVDQVSKAGHPAAEIIQCAEQAKVDLIVMGARGRGAMARFFLGSVSNKLVHYSPCSVLVVK